MPAPENHVQIVGLIRFSYLCSGGFQTKYSDETEHLARLYDPARMEERFFFFENLCLRLLKNQTDKDFKIGILIGESLPDIYRDRLEALIGDMAQAELVALPVLPHRDAMRKAGAILDTSDRPYRIQFRLDDDDAVALNYVARLREMVPVLMQYSGIDQQQVAIAFFRGVTLTVKPGRNEVTPYFASVPTSVGTAIFSRSGWNKSIYDFPHQRILTRLKFISDSDQYMFMRCIHNSNDSYGKRKGYLLPSTLAEQQDRIERQFGMTLDSLYRLGQD